MPNATLFDPALPPLAVTRDARGGATASVEFPGAGIVTLAVSGDHIVSVARPTARAQRGAWLGPVEPPEHYRWDGMLPDPATGVPRPLGTAADSPWQDPVASVLRAHPNAGAVEAVEAVAVWRGLWAALLPALDPRAVALCQQFALPASGYRVFATRPDLADAVTTCPALGAFVTPEVAATVETHGVPLATLLERLTARSQGNSPAVTPGFVAWARSVPWTVGALPVFPTAPEKRGAAVRAFVRLAREAGPLIDHNGIRKLESDDAWRVLNLALASADRHIMVPLILRDPAAAVQGIVGFLPPHLRRDQRQMAEAALAALATWGHANAAALAGVKGFRRAVEDAKAWHRTARGDDLATETARERIRAEREAQRLAAEAARLAAETARQEEAEAARRAAEEEVRRAREGYALDSAFPNPPVELEYRGAQYLMRFLGTPGALDDEGELMDHCVGRGSYDRGCVDGTYRIFTIRTLTNAEVATAQFDSASGRLLTCLGMHDRRVDAAVRTFAKLAYRQMIAPASAGATDHQPSQTERDRI